MEIWDLINPILRVVFYFTAFGTAGTTLFILHFRKHADPELLYHCKNLIHKSALGGILISLILLTSNYFQLNLKVQIILAPRQDNF